MDPIGIGVITESETEGMIIGMKGIDTEVVEIPEMQTIIETNETNEIQEIEEGMIMIRQCRV